MDGSCTFLPTTPARFHRVCSPCAFPPPFSLYDPANFCSQVLSSYWRRVRSELSNYAAIIRPRLYISVNYGAVAARRSDREPRRKREVRRQWGPRRNNGAAPYSWGTVQRYKQYRGGARLIGSRGQPLWELMTLFTPLHPPSRAAPTPLLLPSFLLNEVTKLIFHRARARTREVPAWPYGPLRGLPAFATILHARALVHLLRYIDNSMRIFTTGCSR